MSSSRSVNVNFGPFGLLATLVFVLFLGLKLGGVAPVALWSWWWVTAPLWGTFALGLAIFLVFIAFALFIGLLKALFGR